MKAKTILRITRPDELNLHFAEETILARLNNRSCPWKSTRLRIHAHCAPSNRESKFGIAYLSTVAAI